MSKLTLHDFKFLRDAFPEIQLPDSWGMTTSEKDDVIWNIVLAYLNSFPPSDEVELTQRVEYLTGPEKMEEDFKISIEMCNPFLPRDPCLNSLVNRFKKEVEKHIQSGKMGFQDEPKNFKYLEASSELLECKIVLISFLPQNQIRLFPVNTDQNTPTAFTRHISILNEKTFLGRNEILENFFFCIPQEIRIQKQTQALAKILEGTKAFHRRRRKKLIQRVTSLPGITENFLISLLKSDLRYDIRLVYESPCVLSQLADAGFETDPRTKDSAGKSAFLHALKTEESQLVFLLYDHAANVRSTSCHDPEMLRRLQCLKEHLEGLEKDLESQEISEESRRLFTCLCRYNEFQIEMFKSIMDIRLKNYDDYTKKERECLQRKEILLAILNTYEAYFHSTNAKSTADADDISRFIEFYEHKNYFDRIDFFSAVMFFCNLFRLKERLKLPNKAYLEVESNFFLFIFCGKYMMDIFWKRYKNQKSVRFVSRWIEFQNRLSLHNQICSFTEVLENTELSDDDIRDKVPVSDVRTLTNLPELYDQFLVFRMQHYLNAATGIVVKDLKSILVIERTLQVMGECCKDIDFISVQKIITSGLPSDFIKHLKQIRNRYTHIKSSKLLYKENLEEDVELFEEIQKDLAELEKFLLPIYSFHEYEMEQFLLKNFKESVLKARGIIISKEHENQLKAILPSPEVKENQLSAETVSFQARWNSCFVDMHTALEQDIDRLTCKGNVLDKSTAGGYKRIVQNLISAVEEKIKCLKNISTDTDSPSQNSPSAASKRDDKVSKPNADPVEELDSHFRCVEHILTYITTDVNLTSLISMSEKRKELIRKLRESAIQPQKAENSTQTNTEGNPVAESKTAGTHLPSESVDAHNTNQKTVNPLDAYEEYGKYLDESSTISSRETVDNRTSHKRTETIDPTSCDAGTEGSPKVIHVASENIEEVLALLEDYKEMEKNLFCEFQEDSNKDFLFKSVEKYWWIFKGHNILKKEEKEFILERVPKEYQDFSKLKLKLKSLLAQSTEWNEEIENALGNLKLHRKDEKEIKKDIKSGSISKASSTVRSAKGALLQLKEAIESKEINQRHYNLLCQKLEIPDDAKAKLLKIVKGKNIKNTCNRIDFLLCKIRILKEFLIDEQKGIQKLWNEPRRTTRLMMLVKEKIIQLYLNDSAVQASAETLLFDCMAILDIVEVKHLWKKTMNLLSGTCLRNVLAHGHPLLESLGRLLDPRDLPSELVEKMLKLISDENVIYCIQQILEQSNCNNFNEVMEDERLKPLSEQILNCKHYHEYAQLFQMK